MAMCEFENQTMGRVYEADRYWIDLVSDYHRVTELYDQAVCGPDGMPRTATQRKLITQHAKFLMDAMKSQASVNRKLTAHEVDMAWDMAMRRYNTGAVKPPAEPGKEDGGAE
jgi:hypothetical protein